MNIQDIFDNCESIALTHCLRRLEKAHRALEAIRASQTFDDIEVAWSDFLATHHTVFAKLEQASKANNKAKDWFAHVKIDRRKDDLLRYIHHARNVEEHGIEDVTQRVNSAHIVRFRNDTGSPSKFNARIIFGANGPEVRPLPGNESKITTEFIKGPAVILSTIRNAKHNVTCEPPTTHLGHEIDDSTPLSTAEHAYVYLENLLIAAKYFGL